MADGVASGLSSTFTTLTANPAANAEIAVTTVTTGKIWLLKAFSVSLVQGITQTPQPILIVDDGTNVVFEMFGSTTAQAVSTTCRYTWGVGLPLTGQVGATTNVHSTGPIPAGLLMKDGWRISTLTVGLGANSDYGVATINVVEYG
jgi:hypothetical protein